MHLYHDEVITPKYVIGEAAQKALIDPKKALKERLQNAVKADWNNIQSQFPELRTSNLSDFIVGDINGDGKDDYILILSDLENMKGEALFIYLSDGTDFSMIPIYYWEYEGNYFCWSDLGFMMDLNGDGTKEIGVYDQDGDINSLYIYGWIKDRQAMMRLHRVYELWMGT